MTPPTLVVFGDASVDVSVRVADLPAAGMDTAGCHPMVTAGGSAANCAATVARLGHTVNLVARVGDDLFSQIIIDDLMANGVGILGLEVVTGPSALVIALVEPSGQRTFVSARGPAGGPLPPDLYLPLVDQAGLVHVSGYAFQESGSRSTALHILEQSRRDGIPVSLDPSPLFSAHFDPEPSWWQGIDYVFPNATEAQAITGTNSPFGAVEALLDRGVKTAVVTLGADGCLLGDESGVTTFPAFTELPVVDTTGAGDGFAGAFLAVILSGGSTRRAARVANLAAASVIAQRGGHTGAPSIDDLNRLAQSSGDDLLQKAGQNLRHPIPALGMKAGSRP